MVDEYGWFTFYKNDVGLPTPKVEIRNCFTLAELGRLTNEHISAVLRLLGSFK